MENIPLTLFDFAVIAIVGLSALVALSRGAVREALGILTWIGAFYAAFHLFDLIKPEVEKAVSHDLIADGVTLLIVFFVPLIALKIVAGLIARAVRGLGLGGVDRLLGLIFGFIRGALIVCAAYLVASLLISRDQYPAWVQDAYLKPSVEVGADWLATFIPADIAEQSRQIAEDTARKAQKIRDNAGEAGAAGYGDAARQQLENIIQEQN